MTTSQVSPVFSFHSHQIRTIVENDNLWFVAKDVCTALGIIWNGKLLSGIPDGWQSMRKLLTLRRGTQQVRFISEPAVYKLAFRSNKPEADAFTNWVASEVLPAIRKTGKYEAKPKPKALPEPEKPKQPVIGLLPHNCISLEEQIAPHFGAIHGLIREIYDHQRELCDILRKAGTPVFNSDGDQRSVLVNTSLSLDRWFEAVSATLNGTECTAKAMCVMIRA